MPKTNKHTPGEWRIMGSDIVDSKGSQIAVLWGKDDEEDFKPEKESEANARLIASAPKLLEACKWAVEQFKKLADQGKYPDFMMVNNGGNGITPLVEAIKQAEGE